MKHRSTLRDILRNEKRSMNPIRWKMNYILLPILLAVFILCTIAGVILMKIDENRYAIPFVIIVVGGFLPLVLALLLVNPLVRKKEAGIEAEKYDFDEPAEERDVYVWEKEIRHVCYELEASAFAEFDSAEQIVGTANLADRLHELLDGQSFLPIEPAESPRDDFHVADFTEGEQLSTYLLSVTTAERTRIEVTEMQTLAFSAQGMTVNGVLFPWQDVSAQVDTANHLMLAKINVYFSAAERAGAQVKLDKDLAQLIGQFGVAIENRPVYDYIVSHKKEAVLQILKRGTIKKIK